MGLRTRHQVAAKPQLVVDALPQKAQEEEEEVESGDEDETRGLFEAERSLVASSEDDTISRELKGLTTDSDILPLPRLEVQCHGKTAQLTC